MRGAQKFLLALATAALLSVGLAACGGDSSTDASTPATTTAKGDAGSKAKGDGAENGGADEKGAASFVVPGADNSIQNYGKEGKSREVEAVERVLSRYLEARAKGEWAKSCAYMSADYVRYLERSFGKTLPTKDLSCTLLVEATGTPVAAADRENTLTNGVAALRVGHGGRGYALYHGAGGVNYTMLVISEDGVWKVASLAPTVLPSNPAG